MKTKLIAGLFMLLTTGSSQADAWMLGASFGMALGEADSGQLNDELIGRGISATVSDIDNSRTMQQIFAGYQYLPRWGVELAYVDLGDIKASINGTNAGITDYFTNGKDIYPQTATGWQLSAIYRYPLSGRFQFTGRAGVYNWTTDYTLQTSLRSLAVSESGTDLSYGIGLEAGQWIMAGGIVGQLNLDRYNINGEVVMVLAVGGSFRF